MQSPQFHDTIVIGGGVGGLSAANYHAHSGHSVLVLEKRDTIGGKAAPVLTRDIVLDPGPSIIILKWIYEQAFLDWGEDVSDYIEFIKLDELISLWHRGRQWILPSGENRFLVYIQENFPDDYNGFKWLISAGQLLHSKLDKSVYQRTFSSPLDVFSLPIDIRPSVIQMLQPFNRLVESKFYHPVIKGFLYDFLTYSGHEPDKSSPVSWMILYTMILEGCWYPKGGINRIPQALEKIARKKGVNIQLNQQVTKIQKLEDKYILTTNENSSFSCTKLVANIDPLVTYKLLQKSVPAVKPSFSYCTLAYSIINPINLCHHSLVLPTDIDKAYSDLFGHRKPTSKIVYYLNYPVISDPSTDQYIFVVAPVSTEIPNDDWDDVLVRLDQQVRQDIEEYEGVKNLKLIHSQSPDTFAQRDLNPKGSLFGSGYSWLGLLSQPNTLHDLEGIIHVGGAVQPGAGLPMVLLSGKFSLHS